MYYASTSLDQIIISRYFISLQVESIVKPMLIQNSQLVFITKIGLRYMPTTYVGISIVHISTYRIEPMKTQTKRIVPMFNALPE